MLKTIMYSILICGLCVAGCGKKDAVSTQKESPARKLLREGTVFLKQGDIKSAVGHFTMAIQADPKEIDAYVILAQTFLHLKEFEQAKGVLTLASNRFPEDATIHYFLAVAFEGNGEYVPAVMAARRSVELYQGLKDEDGYKKAVVLLAQIAEAAKKLQEDQAVEAITQPAVVQ